MKYLDSYKKFLDAWGYQAQSRMCIEEMSELTKELCKLDRYNNNEEKRQEIIEKIKEEIADVLVTVEQMQCYFGIDAVEKIKAQKVERAMKKL